MNTFILTLSVLTLAIQADPIENKAIPYENKSCGMDNHEIKVSIVESELYPTLYFDIRSKQYLQNANSLGIESDSVVLPSDEEEISMESCNNAVNVSVELFTERDIAIADLKVFKRLIYDFSIFIRHRTSIDHMDKVGTFFLTDFCYNVFDSFDAVAEIQAGPNIGTIPRVGIQYLNTFNKFFCYILPSYGTKNNTLEFENIIAYNISIPKKKIILRPQIEIIINLKDGDHNFTIGRSRGGVKIESVYFGLGADVYNSKGETDLTPGLFFQMDF